MTNKSERYVITYPGGRTIVSKNLLNEYKTALKTHLNYSNNTIDTIVSFLLSGNRIAVKEYLDWRKVKKGY